MRLHRLAWAVGLIGLPLSHYWLAAKVEPFYSSIYCFLWWSYIFAVDFAVCSAAQDIALARSSQRIPVSIAVVGASLAVVRVGESSHPELVLCDGAVVVI